MDSDSVLPLSESFQLPVIDLSDQILKPGSSKWDEVKTHVRKALEDYGCFEASYNKVSTELKKSVFETMKELFDLPIETKQRNVSSKPFHGYLCHNLYQSLGIDDATVLEKVNDFTQQIWPDQGNKSIRYEYESQSFSPFYLFALKKTNFYIIFFFGKFTHNILINKRKYFSFAKILSNPFKNQFQNLVHICVIEIVRRFTGSRSN